MKINFMLRLLRRLLLLILIILGIVITRYAVQKNDEDIIGSEKLFPLNNQAVLIAGSVPNEGRYSIVVEIPMEHNSSKFVDESLTCDLYVEINKNGVLEKSEIKQFAKIAEKVAKKIDVFSSDHKWLLQKGEVRVAILRSNECVESRLNEAHLKFQRLVRAPTEQVLLRQIAFIIGISLIILAIFTALSN